MSLIAVKYNNGVIGNATLEFDRDIATVDPYANPIAANERRYGKPRSVVSHVDWQSTGLDLGTNALLLRTGYDLDGTLLGVVRDLPAENIKVVEIDDVALTASVETTTAYSALPGTGGGVTYSPRAACVEDGTVFLVAERTNGAVIEGVTLFYSQDRGATWGRVALSTIDGGGLDIPTPSVYGSNADTIGRSQVWAMNPFHLPDGRLAIFIPDYLNAGGATPKGYQLCLLICERASSAVHWTLGTIRILVERWEAATGTTIHNHTAGITGDGLIVMGTGDTDKCNSLVAIELDLDDYETAAITVTNDWFGSITPADAYGAVCPQISMMMPGPDGSIIGTNDTWTSPVLKIANAATAADPCLMTGPLNMQVQITNIFGHHDPKQGIWVTGGFDPINSMRHYSTDGVNWSQLNNCDEIGGALCIAGKCLVAFDSNYVLMLAPLPRVDTVRPLLVNPGGNNVLQVAVPTVLQAPGSTNTLRWAQWSGTEWLYQSDGLPVANAPTTAPGVLGHWAAVLSGGAALDYNHGRWKIADSITIGTGLVGVSGYIVCLGPNATARVGMRVGGATSANDRTAERTYRPDWVGAYVPFAEIGNPSNDPGAMNGAIHLYGGPTSLRSNIDCPMMLVIKEMILGSPCPTYPTALASTGNPPEIERLFLTGFSGVAWTFAALIWVPELSITVPLSGTILTIYVDDDTHVVISYNSTTSSLEMTPTKASVVGDTTAIDIEVLHPTSPISFVVSDNGTALEISVLSVHNGIQTATDADGSIDATPLEIRWSTYDGATVYNLEIGGALANDEYSDASERESILSRNRMLMEEPVIASRSGILIGISL